MTYIITPYGLVPADVWQSYTAAREADELLRQSIVSDTPDEPELTDIIPTSF